MNAEHAPFRHYLDLADARLGSQVVAVSDEWFAPASRMLQAGEPVWKEGVFDDSGKWMDGWETRRKRFEGHDQAVIRLGVPGVLKGVDIDTRFFTGNHPPAAFPGWLLLHRRRPGRQHVLERSAAGGGAAGR